jgi:hypothetical protein
MSNMDFICDTKQAQMYKLGNILTFTKMLLLMVSSTAASVGTFKGYRDMRTNDTSLSF